MKFSLDGYLEARLEPVQSRSSAVQGRVTDLSQPFSRFWLHPDEPISAGGRCAFSFLIKEVTLLEGEASIPAPSGDSSSQSVEITVESVAERYQDQIQARLASFVAPDSRSLYLSSGGQDGSAITEALGAWVHLSNRLLHLVGLIAEMNSSQEMEALLSSIMKAAQEVMEAQASSLMLLDEETGELVIAVPTGPARSEISGIRIPAGQGFGGWVVENGLPLVVPDAKKDARFYGDVAGSDFVTRDLICVPLKNPEGKMLGVLQAVNRRGDQRFGAKDIPVMSILADQAAIALDRDRLTKDSIQRRVLENELQLAADIQAGLWPTEIPRHEGIDLAGNSLPARMVGGDYYDFIELDAQTIALVIADISGKGVAASLLMVELRSALRARIKGALPLADIIEEVNQVLVNDSPSGRFATLFVGLLNTRDLTLEYVNAGHDPPFILSAAGDLEFLEAGGPIVGFRVGLGYESENRKLEPGSVLVMSTDGVTEAQTAAEEFFGRDRLIEEIRSRPGASAEEMVQSTIQTLDRFKGDHPQHDDITLLIARVLDEEASGRD